MTAEDREGSRVPEAAVDREVGNQPINILRRPASHEVGSPWARIRAARAELDHEEVGSFLLEGKAASHEEMVPDPSNPLKMIVHAAAVMEYAVAVVVEVGDLEALPHRRPLPFGVERGELRSEEHMSELQSQSK